MQRRMWGLVALALWTSVVLFTLLRIAMPPALGPHELEPGTYAALRTHLERIAAEPHPVGSPAHGRVRQYLIDEIRKLGLPVEIQQVPISRITGTPRWAPPEANLTNVMTRIDGTGEGPALMLASHYDSAPPSFGASDDGAAVASMLHLLAQASRGDFTNDLIFLFTDAEESCLCGAWAFVNEHPWAAGVGVVLNFEARGTSGKSLMFEATPGYGTLVRTFARHAVSPATSSVYQVVYELLPNDTDLTAFRAGGMHGLNMAFIDSQPNYHTAADTVENLDPRTLLHQYANMRAMFMALANADLGEIGADEPVFFDVLGFAVIVYGKWLAYAGAAAALVLTGYLLHGGVKRGSLRIAPLLLATVMLPVAGAAVVWAMKLLSDALAASGAAGAIGKKPYLALCIVLGMGLYGAVIRLAAGRIGREAIDSGVCVVWLALLLASTALLPGVSYVFLWPLISVLVMRSLPFTATAPRYIAEWLAYLPLIVIWTQLAYALVLAMGIASIVIVITPMLLAGALLQTQRLAVSRGVGAREEEGSAAAGA